jgi:hypothetical protein
MRKLRALAFTAVLGFGLAACSQGGSGAVSAIDVDPKSVEAHVTKLAGEAFKGTATAAADIESLRAALPAEVAVSWGGLSFDAATGSTLLTAVKMTPKDNTEVGVSIDELRLYDLDVDLLKARLAGQRLTESGPLARRIDAKNVSAFGLATLMNGMMGAAYEGFSDGVILPPENGFPAEDGIPAEPANPLKFQPADPTAPAPPEGWPPSTDPDFDFGNDDFSAAFETTFDRYDFSAGRIIIDDIVLKPYQVAPAPAAAANPDDPMASFMSVLQMFAAFNQSFGIDTAAYFDVKGGFAMTQFGDTMSTDLAIKSFGARGMRGGDTDAMYMRGLTYTSTGASMGMPMDMTYAVDLYTIEDFRLGKVMDFLARGVVPPRTETNLMSLGIWRSESESFKLGGKEFYTVAESMFDGSGFHWFIPTKLTASGKGMSVDVAGLMEYAQDASSAMMGDVGDDPFYAEQLAAQKTEMQQVIGTLSKHGLSKIAGDYNFGWNWNAGNGDAKLDLGFDGKDLLKFSTKYEGGFPSFKAVSDLIPDNIEATDQEALANVFNTSTSLKLIEFNMEDKGGLPKIYGLMGDFAAVMGMGAEPMTAENVRTMASSGLKTMAAAVSQDIPEIPGLLNPIASFLELGGKLRLAIQPAKPMPFSSFETVMTGAMMGSSTPSQIIKDLGVKSEHTK